jgi:DNA-binding Lrp family transcriptional regulator
MADLGDRATVSPNPTVTPTRAAHHGPKLRTRKHGAVIPLVQELIDERIIRQVTPIFDTRALGYSSMLVAAKVDPENPWRAANVINEHPGVSHNYLRNHEFNIWFTIATEPDSPLGLEGTLEALGREAGAESIRQLPTLKLFKIRMDLEMEGDTEALAKAVEIAPPAETERQPYDEFDVAVIRATQGDMPVIEEPYVPAAKRLNISQERLLEHLEGMQQRRLLRRVAAILFHRRAGFSANGMGVWKVPDERVMELGPRMAAFRGISHCYQRPTYQDWTRSRPTPGSPIARRCTHRRSSRRSGCCTSPRTSGPGSGSTPACERHPLHHEPLQRALPARPRADAGRSQLAGAGDARDRPRPDLHRARRGIHDHRRRRQRVHRLGELVGPADRRPCPPRGGGRCRLGRVGRNDVWSTN